MLVPVKVAHAVELDPIPTSEGSLILIFPLALKGSLKVIENVYPVTLLTTSFPLPVNEPVRVEGVAVIDWYPTCIGNPFLNIVTLKFPVG